MAFSILFYRYFQRNNAVSLQQYLILKNFVILSSIKPNEVWMNTK